MPFCLMHMSVKGPGSGSWEHLHDCCRAASDMVDMGISLTKYVTHDKGPRHYSFMHLHMLAFYFLL